jgi:hypothetical protein
MDRLHVIQTLMKKKDLNNYLEIGVFNGHIFFRIKSTFKIAVDPEFRFDSSRKVGKTLVNPYNLYNQYFDKTSDAFFAEDAPDVFNGKQVEISLIDGMHEYAYALRDIENTVKYLSNDGVVIVHDCNPKDKEAEVNFAEYERRGFTGIWNGDVWKAILHIRSIRKDLTAFVLDTDQGLGIITKKPDNNSLRFTQQEIERLTFQDLDKNRQEWLDLRPESYFNQYFTLS